MPDWTGPRPPKKPKRPKESSPRPTGRHVGIAWLLVAAPTATFIGLAAYLAHGYSLI